MNYLSTSGAVGLLALLLARPAQAQAPAAFAAPVNYCASTAGDSYIIVVADMNQDGLPDMLTNSFSGQSL